VESGIDDYEIPNMAICHGPSPRPLPIATQLKALLLLPHPYSQHSTAMPVVHQGGGMNGGQNIRTIQKVM